MAQADVSRDAHETFRDALHRIFDGSSQEVCRAKYSPYSMEAAADDVEERVVTALKRFRVSIAKALQHVPTEEEKEKAEQEANNSAHSRSPNSVEGALSYFLKAYAIVNKYHPVGEDMVGMYNVSINREGNRGGGPSSETEDLGTF